MKKQNFNVPNCITALRMVGTLCLLFLRPLSPGFFVTYTLTGLTDALDGWTARKLGSASDFGARLDSVADLMFYGVMLLRFFPVLRAKLPAEIWYAVAAILALRLGSYAVAAVKYRRFASLHTWMNKLTGAAVFAVPYVLLLPFATPVCWGVCGLAALASGQELLLHLRGQAYGGGEPPQQLGERV